MTKTVGLVIQGPVLSPGFGPYEFDQRGNFTKSWIEYDATADILETVSEASKSFDYIVVSTWDSGHARELHLRLLENRKVTVVLSSENTFLRNKRSRGTHKYHQVFSLLEGSKVLIDNGCEVLVKLRSDHRLDISQLYKSAIRHYDKKFASLGVPNINLYELDRLTDFYFVACTKTIRGVCESYLNADEICEDTHRDYFLNFLCFLSNNKDLVSKIQGAESNFIRDYYSVLAWTRYFYPLPSELFKDFYWRGRIVNHRLNAWIRWFYVLQAVDKRFLYLKVGLNLVLIYLVQNLKRPTIKLSSALLFRFYRWRAIKAS